MSERPIALVAMPGGGKSTIGRQLGKRLNRRFVDTDTAIEQRIGSSIRSLFEREGEPRFREIESELIDELTREDDVVLATGGGVVLLDTNRQALHERCHVIYLQSSPEELVRRLKHDTRRPLLQVANPEAKLRELYAQRDPLYRSTAHFVIETGRPSVATLVNMILMQLELAGAIDGTSIHLPEGTSGSH